MKRHLSRKRFCKRLFLVTLIFCALSLVAVVTKSFAQSIQNGDKVAENTELTYYLTVTSDGIDGAGISSETGQIANVFNGTLSVTDKLPENLIFQGFATTENGHFAAVSQSDHVTQCGGVVVDDTQEDGAESGHWNDDESEYYYHGLHYTPNNRTVSYQVYHLQAGCELTIGIKFKTPTITEVSTRYDFYNTAILNDHDILKNSNTVHFWMGRSLTENHNQVSYEFTGNIPANAPNPPESMAYNSGQCITLATEPQLEDYTFSGWSRKDNGRTYPDGRFCLSGTYTFVGSFTPIPPVEQKPVVYEIDGEKPSDYTKPSTKNYEAGKTVTVDTLSANTKIGAYTFDGWSSDDVEVDSGSFTMPNEQVTLRGSFTHHSYNLGYAFVGDAPANADSLLPATESYEAGTEINLAAAPSADGWTFLGWNSTDPLEMPENDLTITGQWQKNAGNFEPAITKTIIDPQEKYHKGDTVIFEVTVKNTADYPIYEVILKDDNGDTTFIAQEGAVIINPQTVEIAEIAAGASYTIRLEHIVTRNENITITDATNLVSATANDGHQLDTTKEYRAASEFTIEAQGEPDVVPPPNNEGNPNTYDNGPKTSDKIILIVSLAGLVATIVLLATNRHNRRTKTIRYFALVVALPTIAGLAYSLLAAQSFAKQQAQSVITSHFSDFNSQEGNSWKLAKNVRWVDADTAEITITFKSFAPERTKPVDLVIAIPNDVETSREDFADYKAAALRTIDGLLTNPQNRIGIVSMDKYANSNRKPSVALAPTDDRDQIIAAIDQILAHDYETSDYVSVPLEAAKLILAAPTDGIERDSIAIATGKHLTTYTNSAGSYDAAKALVPNISYRAGFEYEYIMNGFADRILSEKTLDTSVINRYDIQINDVINTDEFDIVSSPIAFFDEYDRYQYYPIHNYGYDYELTQSGANINLTINNFPVGSDFYVKLDARLKNPVSAEHQVYAPNQSLSFDITTRDFNKELAKEHYDLSGQPTIMNGFRLSYDANAPEGCQATAPADTTIHNAATLVHVDTEPLSCPGYRFAGYSTGDQTLETRGSEYLVMPEEDVTYHATWIKSDIKKSMDGTLSSGTAAYLHYDFVGQLGRITNRYNIKAIKTATSLPENFDTSNQNNLVSHPDSEFPIYAWFDSDTGTIYTYTDADQMYLTGYAGNYLYGLQNLEDISGLADWDVSKVTSFFGFFDSNNSLRDLTPLKDWDVSNSTSFGRMFYYDKAISDLTPLKDWDTSNATVFSYMFEYTDNLSSLDGLQNWDTSNATDMSHMFGNSSVASVAELANWDVSKVTTMQEMFIGTKLTSLQGLADWDVSSLQGVQSMFAGYYEKQELVDISDLGSWQPTALKSLKSMFSRQTNLANVSALSNWADYASNFVSLEDAFYETGITNLEPFADWDVSNIQNFTNAFYNTRISSLEPLNKWRIRAATGLNAFAKTDVTNLSGLEHLIDNATRFNVIFSNMPKLENIDALDAWKTQANKIVSITFSYDSSLDDISGLENWTNTTGLTSLSDAFYNCTSLQDISPLASLNTSNVTTIDSIFSYDTLITSLEPLSTWSTDSLQNMSYAFRGLTAVTSLAPIGSWNTSNVTDMSGVVSGMAGITNLNDLSGWDVAKVTNMSAIFSSMTGLTDVSGVSGWTTTSLTNLNYAFQNDANVGTFTPLNSWYTAKASKTYIFRGVPNSIPKPSWY